MAQPEEELEAATEELEDEPSPPIKRRRVVCKMATAKSVATTEKSRGTKVCSR